MDDPAQIAEGGAEIAVGLLAGAADLGDDMLGARGSPRLLLGVLWFVAILDGIVLWSRFSVLFDREPGWAVLVGGALAMLSLGLIAITASTLRGLSRS